MKPTLYTNVRLLDPDSGLDACGGLLIKDGKIADFGTDLFYDGLEPSEVEFIDGKGHCLAPGLIDMHVHLREPGHEHKETILTGGLAAIAGGVTSVACMPNTKPPIDNVPLLKFVKNKAQEANKVKVYPIAAVTRNLEGQHLTEMGLLAESGAIAYSDDGRPISNSQIMRRALSWAKRFNLMIIQHAEDLSLSNCGCMAEGEIATRLGLPGIPDVSETVMVERDIRLTELTCARYHVAHISTADAVDAVRRAKDNDLSVTCEVAPHHFTFTDNDIGNYRTFFKMSPPLRNERNRIAILEGLKDGTIDAIASDHAPHDKESKRLTMEEATNGVIGLETLLPISLELYHKKHLSLRKVLQKLTCAPADLLKIDAGRLRRGAAADLVLFDLNDPWVIDRSKFYSKSDNTPFDGRSVRGRVMRTIINGQTVFNVQ